MSAIKPNDLLNPTEKTIKNWNCSFIATEGSKILDKLSLEDLAIPYESQYRARVVLKAGEENHPLLYSFIGKATTFLMIKVTYDNLNDPYYQYEQEKYNIFYYFENDPIQRPINRLMILTGSEDEKIPQIYITNPIDYDVTLDIIHATIDVEYDDNDDINGYQPKLNIKNLLNDGLTSGQTSDEYVRYSGETGSIHTYYLPEATGSGKVLTLKNISDSIFLVDPLNNKIDYTTHIYTLVKNDVMRLIDAEENNWDKI